MIVNAVPMPTQSELNAALRSQILEAALALTRAKGVAAATTRAVAQAAKVQVPAIYRLFGDKDRLIEAVAEHALAKFVDAKALRTPDPDPVEHLRRAWDLHVAFGLENPGLFAMMYDDAAAPAAVKGFAILQSWLHAVAEAGRLRTSEEEARALIHAANYGLVLTLIAERKSEGGQLSNRLRDTVFSAVMTDVAKDDHADYRRAASMLRAKVGEGTVLSPGEALLLDELLKRIADHPDSPAS